MLIISRLESQSKFQIFALFSGHQIGLPRSYYMAFSYWALSLSSVTSQFLSLFHWMVFDSIFIAWQWKRSIRILQRTRHNDVITNKNCVRFAEQAQGYLVNVNLFRCGLTDEKSWGEFTFARVTEYVFGHLWTPFSDA